MESLRLKPPKVMKKSRSRLGRVEFTDPFSISATRMSESRSRVEYDSAPRLPLGTCIGPNWGRPPATTVCTPP